MLGNRFRSLDFREVCTHQRDDYDPTTLAKAVGSSVTADSRETVMACLRAVAEADGEVAPREAALIARIEQAMSEGAADAAQNAGTGESA
jgi:tellurite resistance protein